MSTEDFYKLLAATSDVENGKLRATLKYLIELPCATHENPVNCKCCLAAWHVMTEVLKHLDEGVS